MTPDDRMTSSLFLDIIDVLERHGFRHHDDEHTGQAIGMTRDLARVYEGTRDAPYGTYLDQAPPTPPPDPRRPDRQPDPGAVILTGTDISTVLSALYIAAEDNCERAETCADCPDQSCPACQSRLQAARTYDRLTTQILQATQAQPAHRDQPEPAGSSLSPGQPDRAAGIEAGQ